MRLGRSRPGCRIAGTSGQTGFVQGSAHPADMPIDFKGDGIWEDLGVPWLGLSCVGTVDGNGQLTSSVLVSTTSATCGVYLNYGGAAPAANWDAFAAAHPTYRVAKGQQAFIIAYWRKNAVNLTGIDLNCIPAPHRERDRRQSPVSFCPVVWLRR